MEKWKMEKRRNKEKEKQRNGKIEKWKNGEQKEKMTRVWKQIQ